VAGDQLGDVKKLTDILDTQSDTGAIMSIVVIDKAKQSVDIDLLFFSRLPVVTSVDHAALNIAASEMVDCFLGRVRIPSSEYVNTANCSDANVKVVGLLLQGHLVKDLYMVAQVIGAPTYTSTSDLTFKVGVLQD